MKNHKKTFFKAILPLIAIVAFTLPAKADRGPRDRGNGQIQTGTRVRPVTKPKPQQKSIPLDGGLSILLLGAAAFGIKKLRKN